MTWKYRYFTRPRSLSARTAKASGVINRPSRPVPGQKEQRRLHRLVISTYARFSMVRPSFSPLL